MRISAIATALAAMATAVKAISPISIYGSKFFDDNGNQFFMKGIAYQLTPDDPLVDTNQCTLDASLMKTLGVNCIRVYHVDPTADHSGCMAAFAAAGIYTVIDLDTFNSYILPNNPWWNETMLNAYGKVMDSFIKYDNLMGFFIGNEVIAISNQSQAAPFIKAAVRDVKAYGKAKGYRDVPIGYSAADIAELRPMLQDYLTCGGNSSENIDFFGLNSYEWCDPATFQTSGYQNLQNMAVGYPVPIFFSETGCNKPGPRTFGDQDAIFSSPMVDTWSGAIIYEWIEEANDYGIISYGPPANPTATGNDVYDGFTRKGTPTPKSPDFTNLKNKWATISPTGVAKSNYNPTASISVRECPAATPGGWLVNGNVQLPTLGATYTGTFQSSPSATMPPSSTSTGTAASPSTTSKGGASGNKQLIGMSGGLVAVMLIFTLWL